MNMARIKANLCELLTLPGLLSVVGIAMAAVVTATQVADAIRNSPNASPWLQQNADAVGSLAMFESAGRTDVYNGSCCYGVLQLNTDNVWRYARVAPEVFRTWPLRDQVNAWAQLTKEAMDNQIVRGLTAMQAFDGRPVDSNLVLACVQLGIGNCQTMINSGSCSGFRDSNGTSICDMADRIAGGAPAAGGGMTSGGTTSPGTTLGGAPVQYDCVRYASGGCMPMNEAIAAGFESGSGVTMERLRTMIQILFAALTFIIIGSAMLGVWRDYSAGTLTVADLKHYMIKGIIIVGSAYVIISLL